MITENIVLKKIIASEGMILTDGETYGEIIFLAKDSNITKWHEITKDEYKVILAETDILEETEQIEEMEVEV